MLHPTKLILVGLSPSPTAVAVVALAVCSVVAEAHAEIIPQLVSHFFSLLCFFKTFFFWLLSLSSLPDTPPVAHKEQY
jgi:hypothetical protein